MTPSREPAATAAASPPVTARRIRVAFVGTGPGDPGLLTVRAAALLRAADVIVVDDPANGPLVNVHARRGARIVDLDPDADLEGTPLEPACPGDNCRASRLLEVTRKAPPGGLVVRLMTGDPAMFTGLVAECAAVAGADLAFEVVPGVSNLSAVPIYAGVPLTSEDSPAISFFDTSIHNDLTSAAAADITVVMFGTPGSLVEQLSDLIAAGRDAATPVALTAHGTTTHQQTRTTTLGDAADILDEHDDADRMLAIIGQTVELRDEMSWFETKPLFGWNVLVPRTKDQAGRTVDRLTSYGAMASIVPTISVEPPRNPQVVDKALKALIDGRYEWIGFTSVNAVKAIREKFVEYGLDARAFAGVHIAAVGGVTARALEEWGIVPDLVPMGEQSAAGLLEDWPPFDADVDPINRVLLPRADIATETLVAGLHDLGWEVDDVTAYRTVRAAPPAVEIREAIKGGQYDAVVFTSSSTVRNLVGIAGKPHKATVVACIGAATARTATEHGLRVDVVAPEASSDALVDALADFGLAWAKSAHDAGEPVVLPSKKRRRRSTR